MEQIMNEDDRLLQAIYGKAYGAADKSGIADGITHVSTADEFPLDRTAAPAAPGTPIFTDPSQHAEPIIVDELSDAAPEDDWRAGFRTLPSWSARWGRLGGFASLSTS
jgi:hypothetical protein